MTEDEQMLVAERALRTLEGVEQKLETLEEIALALSTIEETLDTLLRLECRDLTPEEVREWLSAQS